MEKPTIYIETSIVSYLTARMSRDIVTLANQKLTQDWWENHRGGYDTFVSQPVVREVSAGDPQAAQKRLQALNGLPLLEVTQEALDLARIFVEKTSLPAKAGVDALHMAIAATSGMDYLLTWNCRHIANGAIRPRVEAVCREQGYQPAFICTPYELMGIGPSEEIMDV